MAFWSHELGEAVGSIGEQFRTLLTDFDCTSLTIHRTTKLRLQQWTRQYRGFWRSGHCTTYSYTMDNGASAIYALDQLIDGNDGTYDKINRLSMQDEWVGEWGGL